MKERDQRRKIEEAEREYEEHLKDWEYGEREKEKQRQYEKESDKEKLEHLMKGRAKLEVYCAFTIGQNLNLFQELVFLRLLVLCAVLGIQS